MSKRAHDYLRATRKPGWFDEYLASLGHGQMSYAWLCGHLDGVIDDIVAAVGKDRLLRLMELHAELQQYEERLRVDREEIAGV